MDGMDGSPGGWGYRAPTVLIICGQPLKRDTCKWSGKEGCLVVVLCHNAKVIRRLLVKLKAVLGKSDSSDL